MTADTELARLERAARALRWSIVEMVGPNTKGHFGGSLSIADVVAALYFSEMRHRPDQPDWPDRDRFLLSKGHVALVQYAALAECGYFPKAEFARFKKLGGMLQGHPDCRKTPGVEASTGSLGQGLSIAAGMAAGLRLEGRKSRVFCVIGDGEIAEGQIWEAALAASQYKLENLVAILDRNCMQATGAVTARFNTNPLIEKWDAFGWRTVSVDGNDMRAVLDTLTAIRAGDGRPTMIIANTVKGAGLPFTAGNIAFHNGAMSEAQFAEARALLAGDAAAAPRTEHAPA